MVCINIVMKKTAVQVSLTPENQQLRDPHLSTAYQLWVRTPLEMRLNHCCILQYEVCAAVCVHIMKVDYIVLCD